MYGSVIGRKEVETRGDMKERGGGVPRHNVNRALPNIAIQVDILALPLGTSY